MSDDQFLVVFTVGFAAFLLGVYYVLRVIEKKYSAKVEQARRLFATYSVPVLIALIFGIGYYHERMGYVCDAAGHNTAGWTCDFGWLLIPLLLISVSISSWHWVVYRNGFDLLDWASKSGRK